MFSISDDVEQRWEGHRWLHTVAYFGGWVLRSLPYFVCCSYVNCCATAWQHAKLFEYLTKLGSPLVMRARFGHHPVRSWLPLCVRQRPLRPNKGKLKSTHRY